MYYLLRAAAEPWLANDVAFSTLTEIVLYRLLCLFFLTSVFRRKESWPQVWRYKLRHAWEETRPVTFEKKQTKKVENFNFVLVYRNVVKVWSHWSGLLCWSSNSCLAKDRHQIRKLPTLIGGQTAKAEKFSAKFGAKHGLLMGGSAWFKSRKCEGIKGSKAKQKKTCGFKWCFNHLIGYGICHDNLSVYFLLDTAGSNLV